MSEEHEKEKAEILLNTQLAEMCIWKILLVCTWQYWGSKVCESISGMES